jgi:hypothetical protein
MNVSNFKTWLTSGIDEAILDFAKGLFHAALVGGALYVASRLEGWHPDTQNGIIAYVIAYRVWKAFLVYVGISGDVKTSVPSTSTSGIIPDSTMGSGL